MVLGSWNSIVHLYCLSAEGSLDARSFWEINNIRFIAFGIPQLLFGNRRMTFTFCKSNKHESLVLLDFILNRCHLTTHGPRSGRLL